MIFVILKWNAVENGLTAFKGLVFVVKGSPLYLSVGVWGLYITEKSIRNNPGLTFPL